MVLGWWIFKRDNAPARRRRRVKSSRLVWSVIENRFICCSCNTSSSATHPAVFQELAIGSAPSSAPLLALSGRGRFNWFLISIRLPLLKEVVGCRRRPPGKGWWVGGLHECIMPRCVCKRGIFLILPTSVIPYYTMVSAEGMKRKDPRAPRKDNFSSRGRLSHPPLLLSLILWSWAQIHRCCPCGGCLSVAPKRNEWAFFWSLCSHLISPRT